MASDWNLTLDQSCFDEWHHDRITIGGNDVTQTLKKVNELSTTAQCDSVQLEEQLTISFSN